MICQGNTCGGERNEGTAAGAEAFSLSAGLTPERRTGKNEDGGIRDADFRANLTKSHPGLWGAPSTGCQQGEPHTGQESPACPSAHHWLRVAWGEHDVSTKAVDGPKDPRGAVQICPLLKLTALIARHSLWIHTSVIQICALTQSLHISSNFLSYWAISLQLYTAHDHLPL